MTAAAFRRSANECVCRRPRMTHTFKWQSKASMILHFLARIWPKTDCKNPRTAYKLKSLCCSTRLFSCIHAFSICRWYWSFTSLSLSFLSSPLLGFCVHVWISLFVFNYALPCFGSRQFDGEREMERKQGRTGNERKLSLTQTKVLNSSHSSPGTCTSIRYAYKIMPTWWQKQRNNNQLRLERTSARIQSSVAARHEAHMICRQLIFSETLKPMGLLYTDF